MYYYAMRPEDAARHPDVGIQGIRGGMCQHNTQAVRYISKTTELVTGYALVNTWKRSKFQFRIFKNNLAAFTISSSADKTTAQMPFNGPKAVGCTNLRGFVKRGNFVPGLGFGTQFPCS